MPYRRSVESGLVVTVDELAPIVDRWRLPTVPSAALGGPVHVTILYPWVDAPASSANLARLAQVLADVAPAALTFDRLERFPSGVLYLALDAASERQCRSLAARVRTAFPDCIPYGGEHPDPTPHLTVAMADDGEALDLIEAEVATSLRSLLPHNALMEELTVMARAEDDRWTRAHQIPLLG
jgi:2'-5' RNA ligase